MILLFYNCFTWPWWWLTEDKNDKYNNNRDNDNGDNKDNYNEDNKTKDDNKDN